ncbi:hypothetical protein HN695_02195 [Candidatus Woesearchaeota archaeon]|jgi:aspartate racemase|nr:hypothetical protein [Candidatus Woesearchaeota archaeon]MBT5272896.1 hypothetical protein [Candidatus Woesearchaeota archaeon]MBT6041362.1 hypothetical protein [Candidatus Woesearchaeota archaeon]MBT6337245.1 hypothetical protein [Candidatus Woesearchaeota archaeon]MBT7927122.1 hypothetical protein [Candidatus Woesearchaeota archaeon]
MTEIKKKKKSNLNNNNNKKDKIKIGILGGIGPEATGMFYNNLIRKFQEKGLIKSNADFPQIIVNSIPAPELVFETLTDEDLQPYFDGLKELDKQNPDFIVMVCNTIHLYHEEFQRKIKTPILDIRAEVLAELKNRNITNVTVLGTPSTVSLGLYAFPGINYSNPSREELLALGKAVFQFNQGFDKQTPLKIATALVEKHMGLVNKSQNLVNKHQTPTNKQQDGGAELVLLACTEIGVMLRNVNLPVLDPMDVLVGAVVRRCV